jgi:hypothetical protein
LREGRLALADLIRNKAEKAMQGLKCPRPL